MAADPSDVDLEKTFVYHQLDEYPWDEDQEFQGGLRAILGSVQDHSQAEHLTLRAKCYYWARKSGSSVDFNGYKHWVETQGGSAPSNGIREAPESTVYHAPSALSQSQNSETGDGGAGGFGDAPHPASFAEICDMIAEGKPIPGIKDIPDTILEGQASESQTTRRKKPWERNANAQAWVTTAPSWMR